MPNKTKETLIALMVSLDVCSETTAADYAGTLDNRSAQSLIDVLKEKSVGATKNLAEGKGGFLSGLRKVVEARRTSISSELPSDPKKLTPPEKEIAIDSLDESIAKSNTVLVDGLRLILASRRDEQHSSLSKWAVELSDADFPLKVLDTQKAGKARDEQIIGQLEKALDQSRESVKDVAKKHSVEPQ